MATQATTPNSSASKIQRKIRGLRRGWVSLGSGPATTDSLGGMVTGLPHLRQNCASSGNAAPHLLQPRMTFVADDVVSVGIQTLAILHKRRTKQKKLLGPWSLLELTLANLLGT